MGTNKFFDTYFCHSVWDRNCTNFRPSILVAYLSHYLTAIWSLTSFYNRLISPHLVKKTVRPSPFRSVSFIITWPGTSGQKQNKNSLLSPSTSHISEPSPVFVYRKLLYGLQTQYGSPGESDWTSLTHLFSSGTLPWPRHPPRSTIVETSRYLRNDSLNINGHPSQNLSLHRSILNIKVVDFTSIDVTAIDVSFWMSTRSVWPSSGNPFGSLSPVMSREHTMFYPRDTHSSTYSPLIFLPLKLKGYHFHRFVVRNPLTP